MCASLLVLVLGVSAFSGGSAHSSGKARYLPSIPFQVALAPNDYVTHANGMKDTNATSAYVPSYMGVGDTLTSPAGARLFPSMIGVNDGHGVAVMNDGTNNTVLTVCAPDSYDNQYYLSLGSGTACAMNVLPNGGTGVHIKIRTNKVTTAANGSLFTVSDNGGSGKAIVENGSVQVHGTNSMGQPWTEPPIGWATIGTGITFSDTGLTHASLSPCACMSYVEKVQSEVHAFMRQRRMRHNLSGTKAIALLRKIEGQLQAAERAERKQMR